MMKINEIWEELENDNSFTHGVLYRRYSGSVLPDVFIALQNPEKFRSIAATVNENIDINLAAFSNLKDINIDIRPDDSKRNKKVILFRLINNQHLDIFSILCEDLITSISALTDEKQIIKELFNRFEKWKSLFDKAAQQGLTPDEQRGLFGELFFIRKFLQANNAFYSIINSWVGPEQQIRDFQFGSWSIEVKTTHGNNHQKAHISSERQLDSSNLDNLFLYHISLEARQQSGETLIQIVDSVAEILDGDTLSLNRFRHKLLEVGYFEQHKHLYGLTGYFIRQDIYYKVEDDFPRIEECDIREGVGDVKYSIILSHCSPYTFPENEVFQTISF